jgi:hypothetical protein
MTAQTTATVGEYRGEEEFAALRARLSPSAPLPAPAGFAALPGVAGKALELADELVVIADRDGVAAAALDRPLTAPEFLAVGERLGRPIPEGADAVQQFVTDRFILNLVTHFGATDDVDRQPFSRSPLLLHSEGSRRTLDGQPRHLLFNCVEPSPAVLGGQTVIARNTDIAGRLSAESREVLGLVRYAGEGGAPILRWDAGRPVFCFRDFGDAPLSWESGQPIAAGTVARAFGDLMRAIYDPAVLTALTWNGHLLLVLDNHRVMHARTAFPPEDAGASRRHLQRLRLLPPSA